MDGTLALATIGAITGTASAVAQVLSTLRDRPRIKLNFYIKTAVGQRPEATLEVTNAGQRATTVREAGFYAKETEFITYRGSEPHLSGKGAITFGIARSIFLEAGESKQFFATPDTIDMGLHADLPLRLYAIDIHGRRIWGKAAPITRMLLGEDPPLRDDDPPGVKMLLGPSEKPLFPAQVEPRWKVWKRRELRRPETWKH
jgi:hypothetical protein